MLILLQHVEGSSEDPWRRGVIGRTGCVLSLRIVRKAPKRVDVVVCHVLRQRANVSDDDSKKLRKRRQPRVTRIPSVIPGVKFDLQAMETHNQEMVVVRGKGGEWILFVTKSSDSDWGV